MHATGAQGQQKSAPTMSRSRSQKRSKGRRESLSPATPPCARPGPLLKEGSVEKDADIPNVPTVEEIPVDKVSTATEVPASPAGMSADWWIDLCMLIVSFFPMRGVWLPLSLGPRLALSAMLAVLLVCVRICSTMMWLWSSSRGPAGYQQTKRKLRRDARALINEYGYEGLKELSSVRLITVVNNVKLIFPFSKPTLENKLAVTFEVTREMRAKGFTDEEIHADIDTVCAWVFIPSNKQLSALILLNSGPARARMDERDSYDQGANLGEWWDMFSRYFKLRPSDRSIN